MNILLLVPPTDLSKSYGGLKDFASASPSLGLAYIAAVLLANGYNVKILDAYASQSTKRDILRLVEGFHADWIGINMLTTSADVSEEIIVAIRASFPLTKIALGNVHASLFAESLLERGVADVVVHREGEETFLEYLRCMEEGGDPSQVKGISFLLDGRVHTTAPRPFLENLDSLPFPAWETFPLKEYFGDPRGELISGEPVLPFLATRGCPNKCSFCSNHTDRSMGTRYRMRSPQNIVDELIYVHERFGVRTFNFMDLAFPLNKRHSIAVCQEIVRRGVHEWVAWHSECRVKPLDAETLDWLRKAGCRRLCFGIESGSDRILKMIRKNFTTADVENAVQLTKKAGIDVDGMFIMGFPTETEQEIKQTIELAVKLNVRFAILNIFVPYPGCELHDTLKAEGRIHFNAWRDFTSYPGYAGTEPVYVPDTVSREDLLRLQRYAMRRFYLRPRFILEELRRFNLSKLRMYINGLKALLCG
jgi:radical SAM superfamily enzyme YgiQ (UPF0313 family)